MTPGIPILLTLAERADGSPLQRRPTVLLVRQVRNLVKPPSPEARGNALRRVQRDLEHQRGVSRRTSRLTPRYSPTGFSMTANSPKHSISRYRCGGFLDRELSTLAGVEMRIARPPDHRKADLKVATPAGPPVYSPTCSGRWHGGGAWRRGQHHFYWRGLSGSQLASVSARPRRCKLDRGAAEP